MIRVVFFGTAEYAAHTLQALHASPNYTIAAVVTQPDKPVGRKHILTPTPVKQAAEALSLSVFDHPKDIKNISADVGVLVYYGKILSSAVLNAFPHGIINIHPSLLPAWRGPSPAQAAILAGDTTTGVTVMKLDATMDTGPILAQTAIDILPTDTAQDVYDRLFPIGIDVLLEVLPTYIAGTLTPQSQTSTGASYSHIITREDGKIAHDDTPEKIIRTLRAFHPWPGVFCVWKNKRIKILQAHIERDALVLDRLQMEGKQPMSYQDFMHGYPEFLLADIG